MRSFTINMLKKIIFYIIFKIKAFCSVLILDYILGWVIINSINTMDSNSKRHIVIYTRTSFCEHMIGYLLSLRYQIPLVFLVEKELKKDPISDIILKLINRIYVDRSYSDEKKEADGAITYIASELAKYDNHIFAILIDGVQISQEEKKQGEFHKLQGFYQIAKKTESMIHQIIFDFENQILKTENIQNYEYNAMITKILEGIKNEKPYTDTTLEKGKQKIKKTSMINMSKSILMYIPPLFIIYVLFTLFF